ncbi:MAG TPA: pseudouridine synthase [Solirubrobacteraceae bacterium]|nr:pseudouridine synthase [Solirubrobacteraceae bacterium]
MSAMRLAKHLAHAGVASRRAAEALVADGRVTVDGEIVADPARDVGGDEAIAVDGRPIAPPPAERVVYAVNKPAGVVSTARDTHGRPTVVALVPSAGVRLYPVGRLDADTTGLLLLTDDGDLAHRLTHPRFGVPKTYRATVAGGPVAERALRALREGVELDDGRTAPARVRRLGPGELELTLREGRKRQVRRMCEAVGHRVVALRRVAFGPLRLGDLREGAARRLSAADVQRLRDAAAGAPPRGSAAGGGGRRHRPRA